METGGEKFKTKRLLSISQPELDTSDVFDIPSPPPVAANHLESGFSALNQRQPSVSSNTHAGTQEPLKGFDQADVPDEAPKAPIATIPELQMGTAASSEESISAHENVAQSGLTPTATAHTENQIPPFDPADQPQVHLDPPGHTGADSESAAPTIVPQNNIHQRSATTGPSCDASVREKTSHDQLETPDAGGSLLGQPRTAGVSSTPDAAIVPEPRHQAVNARPEAGSASAPGEISAPEAVPPSTGSRKKSPHLVNQDEVYGALYDTLFPQSFTSEVLSSLSTPPPQNFTENQQSKTIVWTVDEYRTETSTPTHPGQSARPAAGRGDPIDPYADRVSVSGGSRLTSYQTEAEPSRGTDIHSRAPPSSQAWCFVNSGAGKQSEAASCLPEGPLLRSQLTGATPSTVLQIAAPPVSDYGTAPGRDVRVTESVPALTRARNGVGDQLSSRAVPPSPAPENKTAGIPEWKPQTPAPPGDMDRFLSPTYLSVGSDDGSAVDIYYSAEEDNTESGDDEMYTIDEGGVLMGDGGTTVGLHRELVQQGDFSASDVSDRAEGTFRGILMQKSLGEKNEEGQARGHGPEAHLQDNNKLLEAMAQVEGEGTETREKLLAKPVLQVIELAECGTVPPSAEKCGRLEDSKLIWARKLETEEPPNRKQHSLRQPLDYLSDDVTQEVVTTSKSATAEKQVSIVAEADKSSEDSRHTYGHCVTSAAADPVALVTGSLTHTGSTAEHNRLPQSAEWVDTITRSTGRSRNLELEAQLHLTDTHRTAAAPLSGSQELPAGAQLDPSRG